MYAVKNKETGQFEQKTIPTNFVLWSTGIAMNPFTHRVTELLPNQVGFRMMFCWSVETHIDHLAVPQEGDRDGRVGGVDAGLADLGGASAQAGYGTRADGRRECESETWGPQNCVAVSTRCVYVVHGLARETGKLTSKLQNRK